jgi:hypothetical protein
MAYATVIDVQTRLGRPITDPTELAQVTAWLGDVEALILERVSDLATVVDTDDGPSTATVVRVECQAVIRKVLNPEGKVSEGVDDYQSRLNADDARTDLFLTDDEWGSLLTGAGAGAFSVRPSFESDTPVAVSTWGWEW